MIGVLLRRSEDTDTWRGGHVLMDTGTGVMPADSKDCWQRRKPEGAGRDPTVFRVSLACDTLISCFWPPELSEKNFFFFFTVHLFFRIQ